MGTKAQSTWGFLGATAGEQKSWHSSQILDAKQIILFATPHFFLLPLPRGLDCVSVYSICIVALKYVHKFFKTSPEKKPPEPPLQHGLDLVTHF